MTLEIEYPSTFTLVKYSSITKKEINREYENSIYLILPGGSWTLVMSTGRNV